MSEEKTKMALLRARHPEVARALDDELAALGPPPPLPVPAEVAARWLSVHGLPPGLLAGPGRAGELVQARRDIALAAVLGVARAKLVPTYLAPAMCHYRLYASYRERIDTFVDSVAAGRSAPEGGAGASDGESIMKKPKAEGITNIRTAKES